MNRSIWIVLIMSLGTVACEWPMGVTQPLEPTPDCGDAYVTQDEECDDGNTNDGDACDSSCQWENPVATFTSSVGASGSIFTSSSKTISVTATFTVAVAGVSKSDFGLNDYRHRHISTPAPFPTASITSHTSNSSHRTRFSCPHFTCAMMNDEVHRTRVPQKNVVFTLIISQLRRNPRPKRI